ncbi:hypothetical protein CXB51_007199 [Gossypium anomalum]|uniref:Uncharacterized protein n=1 Tax=Gossypium anomalum TaxID=47600 RepID=A0A8J5YZW3_9ROSI|nr:hypothetical protein CXB51_007199 [Gossypium anomalum]
MTVVVTPSSGSEKLRLREVFTSVQDSGSLSEYIRTYGFSVSKLGSFVMENGLLDRMEGNANVHRWSEQTQLEKGDSIAMGYVSELSYYTRISVTQNNLQELKEIWDQWGNETKQLFYDNYGDLPYLLDIQSDRIYSRATCVLTFWKKLMTIIGMSEQWITARIKEKGECKCISWDTLEDLILTHPDETKKGLGYVDEATTDLFHRLSKRVTSVSAILAETFRSLGACRRAGAGRFIGCAQLLMAWFYSHFRLIDEIVYQGAIGYAPLFVLRQHVLREFVPATHGLAQSEFVYRGADYKKKVSEVSSAWNKTCRLKGVAISPATTLEYVKWMS